MKLSSYLNESIWAVTEDRFATLRAAIEAIENGTVVREPETRTQEREPFLVMANGDRVSARDEASLRAASRGTAKAVLVVPFAGTIYPRMGGAAPPSGGTNLQATMSVLRRAVMDPSIASVIADFDSPGGMVAGIPEAAAEIRAMRGIKPMSSVANFQMSSAAFYLGSSFDEVVASPSSSLGSIGVVAQYVSEGAALEKAGIAVQTLKYPPLKAELDGVSPMSDEAMAYRMEQIRRIYDDFVSAVAAGLGISKAKVESDFGNGRSLDARDAVRVGMATRTATFDTVLADHMTGAIKRRNSFQRTSANRMSRAQAIELEPQRNADFLRARWQLPGAAPMRTANDLRRRWRLGN